MLTTASAVASGYTEHYVGADVNAGARVRRRSRREGFNASTGSPEWRRARGISINGTNSRVGGELGGAADLVTNAFPTSFGGAGVQSIGKAAYLQYVSHQDQRARVPSDSNTGRRGECNQCRRAVWNSVTATMQPVLARLVHASGYVRAVRYPDSV